MGKKGAWTLPNNFWKILNMPRANMFKKDMALLLYCWHYRPMAYLFHGFIFR
jgi:hypothetical protein